MKNTEKPIKLVCLKIIDPKDTGNKAIHSIIRIPMDIARATISNLGKEKAYFVSKSTYKRFLVNVYKAAHPANPNRKTITAKEIKYSFIIKEEQKRTEAYLRADKRRKKGFVFPAYTDDTQQLFTSQIREEKRLKRTNTNNRSKTDSRKNHVGFVGNPYGQGGGRSGAKGGVLINTANLIKNIEEAIIKRNS